MTNPTGLTTLTMLAVMVVRVVAHALPMAIIRPVQKSPSLTVIESWLSIVVFSVPPTVSRTMCFRGRPIHFEIGTHCAEIFGAQRLCPRSA